MPELSPGLRLALDQLDDICEMSAGALEIVGESREGPEGIYLRVHLSLATEGYRKEGGFNFRERERLVLTVYPDFPFAKPDLSFDHKRFIGQPHVQWGHHICLYQSPETEYQPADGLFGLFERVNIWMEAAGAGQLDPEDAPLHPPVAYPSSLTRFVVKIDTPCDNGNQVPWVGRADLRKVRADRYDVVGWTSLDDWNGLPAHPIAVAVLLKQALATEYPTKVYDLIQHAERAGLPFSLLFQILQYISVATPEGEPGRIVFGAPMRRKTAGEPLRPHLTVWEVAPEPLAALRTWVAGKDANSASREEAIQWLATAKLTWCFVSENRPEIVHRRDGDSLAATLTGKRVLLLGCGALGSAVAENVVRAGATRLCVADDDFVTPGILVRQRYADADIGLLKASALKSRVDSLGFPCEVSTETRDLANGILSRFTMNQWDLVVDATASNAVHHRLERELVETALEVPLISLAVSAAANHGWVAVRMPKYSGGLLQIARRAKLEAFARDASHSLVKAFWPAREDIEIFQPEPGCSSPTFVGSAMDIDHHAAGLMNVGLWRVQGLSQDQASADVMTAPWLVEKKRSHLSYSFNSYSPQRERRHGYFVVRSDTAASEMSAELRRIARIGSSNSETGGLIFGEIDDSHRVIWIDSVSGPPPDSKASPQQFLCGTAGTKELAAFKAKQSGASTTFIGIWHTHPISRGNPSQDDLKAMVELLHFQEANPRQVVMLILGFAASKPAENYYLYRRGEFWLISIPEPERDGAA